VSRSTGRFLTPAHRKRRFAGRSPKGGLQTRPRARSWLLRRKSRRAAGISGAGEASRRRFDAEPGAKRDFAGRSPAGGVRGRPRRRSWLWRRKSRRAARISGAGRARPTCWRGVAAPAEPGRAPACRTAPIIRRGSAGGNTRPRGGGAPVGPSGLPVHKTFGAGGREGPRTPDRRAATGCCGLPGTGLDLGRRDLA